MIVWEPLRALRSYLPGLLFGNHSGIKGTKVLLAWLTFWLSEAINLSDYRDTKTWGEMGRQMKAFYAC